MPNDSVLVVLVVRPEGFSPSKWDDFPESAMVSEFSEKAVPFDRGVGTIYDFNEFSIKSGNRLWAVLSTRRPEVAEVIDRQIPVFR